MRNVQLLNLSTAFPADANAQLSISDDQIPNYSHQNETEDLEPNHIFNVKSPRIKELDQNDGWSDWSEWSTCSRSCDGGVTTSLRKCNHKKGCTGSAEKHKICNMQPCPTVIDFRATQCSTYNNKAYRGRLYQWLPYRDPLDPCSLTCKAKIFNFVAKLAPRVEDGTRCRDGSLDMCVAGKCLSVGCDLQLGSDNKIDECGICGGDGSSCKRPTYIWSEENYSPCSVSCGRGYQMSHPICVDKEAKEHRVDEIFCDPSTRPRPLIVECNTQKCPPFWIIEAWTTCNRKCGGGKQTREVYCVQDVVNGTRVKVPDNSCPKQKPTVERSCNIQECPQWFEGPWSECSATCGAGHQTRAVVCRDVRGFYSNECSNETKPNDKQNCTTGIQCLKENSNSNENSQEDSPRVLPFHLPWVQKFTNPSISTEPNFIVGEWSSCSTSCGKGIRKRSVECKIFLEFSRTVARLPDSQCPGFKPIDFEVCITRECDAPVIQDEGPDEEDVDDEDDKDNNIITSGVEKPVNKMIPLSKIGIDLGYYWKSAGFTQCTASCLGGTQESIIQCVKEKDQTVVNPYLCDINKKPDSFTRTCNDNPCPPRWNITEFGICSKECGGGVQTREVQCVHEVTRGTANTIVVPNHQCPEPVPRSKQFCNVFDCPPQWKTESWTKCSRSCGGGVKTRKLKCIKELAFGQMVEQPPSKCPKKRPKITKMCNSKQCRNPMLELRKAIRQSPVKHSTELDQINDNIFIQKEPKKRISLKVSGQAIVLEGTLIRLRCPGSKTDRKSNHTEWLKNNAKVSVGRRLQYMGRNALRIKNVIFSDSAIYSCSWNNKTIHSIDLQVRHFSNSDEDKTVERPNFTFKRSEMDDHIFGNVVKNVEETNDQSHNVNNNDNRNNRDQKLGKPKPKRAYRRRKNNKQEAKVSSENLYSAESPDGNPNPSLDTWEVNYGTDQKIENQNTFNFYNEKKVRNYESSEEKFNQPRDETDKNDSVSKLQQLLTSMRKSNKMPNDSGTNYETIPNDSSFNENISDVNVNKARDDKIETAANLLANTFVLGKGNPKKLKFDWMTTEWSNCTLPCGGTGFQVRASQCYVIYENVSKTIDNTFCIDADLKTPETIRNCGTPECPFWESGQWSDCNECINLNTAVKRREVRCALNNGTILEHNKCSAEEKPVDKEECFNDRCQGTWIVGDWSDCNGKCGEEGFQSRIIQCVWFNTAKPAGNACKDKPRPEVLQSCLNKSCSQSNCVDKSKHCNLAKSLNMCRISHYRQQCCSSCQSVTE